MKKITVRFLRDNRAVTALEYGLIAGLIAVVIGTSVQDIGSKLNTAFQTIATLLTPAT